MDTRATLSADWRTCGGRPAPGRWPAPGAETTRRDRDPTREGRRTALARHGPPESRAIRGRGVPVGWHNLLAALLAAALGLLTSANPGRAADVHWVNPAGGTFSNGSNWDTGIPPGPGDTAFITLDGTYNVVLDSDASIHALTLGGASGTQALSLSSRTLTLSGTGAVGSHGALLLSASTLTHDGDLTNGGSMQISGGCHLDGNGTFANAPAATLRVGGSSSGNASLTVGKGSTLTVNGSCTQTGGQATLDSGTIAVSSVFDLSAGELNGSGTVDGDLVSSGVVSPGFSPGHLVVTGQPEVPPPR